MSYRHQATKEVSTGVVAPNAWEQRRRDWLKMVDAYLRRWVSSSLHSEAVLGGFECDMLRYVREVAELQAQLIVGERNVGYCAVIVFSGRGEDVDYKRLRREWFEEQCRIASGGVVDVRIPSWKLTHMRRWADWRKNDRAVSN